MKPRLLIALAGAILVNVILFSLMALNTRDVVPPMDMTKPTAVSLVSLKPPEPEQEKEVERPKPPQPQPEMDFTPDLTPPPMSFSGPSFDGAVVIHVGEVGGPVLSGTVVFNAHELDQAPQVVLRVPPAYPYRAREQGVEGVVQVKLLVNVDGSVGEVQILSAQPQGIFEDSVRKTVPLWKFRPGVLGGEAVTSWIVTNVRFDIN